MEKSSIKLIEQPSPLGSALANLFMGYNEQKWLESVHGGLVKFYRRYVDDIFPLFGNEHQALNFLKFLNIQHPNLNFTKEKKHMKSDNYPGSITSIYRKSTFTELLQNYDSFVPFTYKKSFIKL